MITNEGSSTNLKGLSGDTKPTDVEINTLFLELDTGDFYYFDTDDDWHKVGGDTESKGRSISTPASIDLRAETVEKIGTEENKFDEADSRAELIEKIDTKENKFDEADPTPIKGGDDE